MPRQKRTASKVIQLAATRSAGLESIDPAPDMGTEISVAGFRAVIADAQAKQSAYNTLLAEADEAQNVFNAAEAKVRDYAERMLAAVAAKFGRDSNEYEMAGGRRKSERRRNTAQSTEPVTAKAA